MRCADAEEERAIRTKNQVDTSMAMHRELQAMYLCDAEEPRRNLGTYMR